MLHEINTSLHPVIDDFDRYWAWQHRRARLEEDLGEIEQQLGDLENQREQHRRSLVVRLGWLGELLVEWRAVSPRITARPSNRQLEYHYRIRRNLIQQIDHLDQQMEQVGDPTDLYEELIALKREYLISENHPCSMVLTQIGEETRGLQEYVRHLIEIRRSTIIAQQTLSTLLRVTRRGQESYEGWDRQTIISNIRRPMSSRLRKGLHLVESAMAQLAQHLNELPDYDSLPPSLQAGHFEQFHRRYQRLLAGTEPILGGKWQPLVSYTWTTYDRIEELLDWVEKSQSAAEQRKSFLIRKQERLIREAE